MLKMIEPRLIATLHEVRDRAKLEALIASMREHGWRGRPILAVDRGNGIEALTGSHRIPAAIKAGLEEIPCYIIEVPDNPAWIDEVLEARDDEERLKALRKSRDKEAVRLMKAEIEAQ